jgi:predicted RNA-binding protein associated with RNAse of E/G family
MFRSVFRGRLLYAVPAWLLRETAEYIVTATVPGAETRQLSGPRNAVIRKIAAGCAQTEVMPWRTNRVLWLTPFGAAHAIGHFWNAESGAFVGHYVNLQAPLRRSAYGFDSFDHVLDIVVSPDGSWHWKDEDEFDEALNQGLFSAAEAANIRSEGERVIERFEQLLPTGWEDWLPDPAWPVESLQLHPDLRGTS